MHSGKALVSLCLSLCVLLPGLLVASLLDAIDSDQLTPEALLNDAGGSAGTETGGGRPPLRFKSDDTFRILQLTDLHYGESAALDLKSDEVEHSQRPFFSVPASQPHWVLHLSTTSLVLPVQVQRAVLAAERPDLVVFSGDMVSGWHCKPSAPLLADCGPGWFAARWRQLIAPVHEAGIPYAITLGNHE
jgi:pre-mRNA-splicing factor SYF1